jgi:hypothetical protein
MRQSNIDAPCSQLGSISPAMFFKLFIFGSIHCSCPITTQFCPVAMCPLYAHPRSSTQQAVPAFGVQAEQWPMLDGPMRAADDPIPGKIDWDQTKVGFSDGSGCATVLRCGLVLPEIPKNPSPSFS